MHDGKVQRDRHLEVLVLRCKVVDKDQTTNVSIVDLEETWNVMRPRMGAEEEKAREQNKYTKYAQGWYTSASQVANWSPDCTE